MSGNQDVAARTRTGTSSFVNTLKSAKFEHMVAGMSGGVVSTLVLHPLDLLKIRFAGKQTCFLCKRFGF